jgi:hypothetical protein
VKPKVYLETTVVSLLTARPTRDVIMLSMIEQTKKWWEAERDRFELFVSDIVIREAAAGDVVAARRRSEVLQRLAAVENDAESQALADVFLQNMALPAKATDDALHIAIAAVNQADYLLTWNCRHIANAAMRPKLEGLCLAEGYRCPIICTPPELRKPGYED